MFDTSKELGRYHSEKVLLAGAQRTEMRERRDSNRKKIRASLVREAKPKPIGFHSQGSYAMRTMIQAPDNDYDIDDGIYFQSDQLIGPKDGVLSALAARKMICEAAADAKFSTPPQVLKNCVRVFYNAGYHVDIPVYRKCEERDLWSGKTKEFYELASADWKRSDSKSVTKWFREEAQSQCPDGGGADGQFVTVVRMLKAFCGSRASWKGKVGTGFICTALISYGNFRAHPDRLDMSVRRTFEAIRDSLRYSKSVKHPVLEGEHITSSAEDPRVAQLFERLDDKLDCLTPLDRTDCSFEEAMAAWDKFFGTDWFSSQPVSEGGSKVGQPSAPVQKRGPNRYAKR